VELDDLRTETSQQAIWAYLATVGSDGKPDVVPVHPAWEGDTLWFMTAPQSVKARNIAANPNVALHWQANDNGDSVELWGTAVVSTDIDTKRRLWTGVFDYNLDDFVPGGPDSPDACMVSVEPERALVLKQFGAAGRSTWKRG
jgi:PPOX class probable F420-dependent enzyme